jgi:ribosomal protein S2
MKIYKTKQKKYNLINHDLLTSRSYLGLHKLSLYYLNSKYIKGFRNKFCIFDTLKTKNFIKKALLIIYKYHYLNKKILFIGFPNIKTKNYNILFNQTNHYYIPHSNWINNSILNYHQIIKSLKKKIFLTKNLNINRTPDLIVLFNQTKEIKAFKESINSKIPLITFLDSCTKSDQTYYKIPGGFQNYKTEKICYLLLKSILTLPKSRKAYEKKIL